MQQQYASIARLWSGLAGPHPRITAPEDRHGAVLFAALMMVHVACILAVTWLTNYFTVRTSGRTIWADRDLWVMLAGMVLIVAAYAVLRAGFYRAAVVSYVLVAAFMPLIAPFVNDPNAEIGILALAIIPVLLTAFAFSGRWVLAVLALTVSVAVVRLLTSGLPPRMVGTGFTILVGVSVAGSLVMVFRRRFSVLERLRVERVRESEGALKRSTERLRVLLENSQDVLLGVDRNGIVVFAGGALKAGTGMEPEDVLGHSLFDGVHKDDIARVRHEFEAVLAEPGASLRSDWRGIYRDGSYHWYEALATNRIGVPGLDNVVISLRDVTQRVNALEELRQSQQKYRNLFETVSDGIYNVDEEGRILEANIAACTQLDYSREELLALNVRDVAPGLDEEVSRRAQRIMGQAKGLYETEHRRKDGTRVSIDLSIAPIVFEGKRAFLGVARDVTGHRPVRE